MTTDPADAAYVAEENAPTGGVAAVVPAIDRFEAAFVGFSGCLGEPTILFEDLPGRKGEYRVGSSTVALNPNRTVDGMGQVVVHELAHHLMIECGVDKDVSFREQFYASQGIPQSRGWYDYSAGWSATPAEQFAEAVSLYVLATNDSRITIKNETLQFIADLAGPTATESRWLPKGAAVGLSHSPAIGQDTPGPAPLSVNGLSFVGRPGRPTLGAAVGLSVWRNAR